MKLCAVVALFLIGVIPGKISKVNSQPELHWDPPKISRLITKMHQPEPSIPDGPDGNVTICTTENSCGLDDRSKTFIWDIVICMFKSNKE